MNLFLSFVGNVKFPGMMLTDDYQDGGVFFAQLRLIKAKQIPWNALK
jgi:hypothetical protein